MLKQLKDINKFKLLASSQSKMSGQLTTDILGDFHKEFVENSKHLFAQNVISRADPFETCIQRKVLERSSPVFTHKVDEVKPITNQKSSGRCWIFAALNTIRIPFMKANNLEDFEFSQAYLFFWDKIERSNYFLNTVADIYQRSPKEDANGRLGNFLLKSPISDGGQWDMIINLIEKHGVMPKRCFPETFSCENSLRMNRILTSKLREFAYDIHRHIDSNGGTDDGSVRNLIYEQMKTIFRIVSICLGSPPKQFTWEYYDKSKKYQKVENISPLDFYENLVKPNFDINSKVCLVSDPRPANKMGKTYTVDCLGNVVGGRRTIYNNQPIDVLMKVSAKSIEAGEPVWFGCDVGKHIATKEGLLDLEAHDYQMAFDTSVHLNLSKADRLIYGDSLMTHAMVLTGFRLENYVAVPNSEIDIQLEQRGLDEVTKDEEDDKIHEKITKWRVENSWGEDKHEKGYLAMTNDWFSEFVFEVVVDRKFCSQEVLQVLDQEPEILPAWDPMGVLVK